MLRVRTERADDLAILKCNGRIVRGLEIVLVCAVGCRRVSGGESVGCRVSQLPSSAHLR